MCIYIYLGRVQPECKAVVHTEFCTFLWRVMCHYWIGFLWIFCSVVQSWVMPCHVGWAMFDTECLNVLHIYKYICINMIILDKRLCLLYANTSGRNTTYWRIFSWLFSLNLIIHSCTKTCSCPLKNNDGCWFQMHNSPMYIACTYISSVYYHMYKAYTGHCHIKGDTTDLLLN